MSNFQIVPAASHFLFLVLGTLVSRLSPALSVPKYPVERLNFFLFFTQIFLRSNSGCHDGGVGAGYALDIMENWGFGTAPGTIQTQIMLSSCYDFGERIFHAGGHPRTPKGYRFNCRWKYY